MGTECDKAIMKSLVQKYQRFGYLSLKNHLNVYSDFIVQLEYKETEGGLTKREFEIRKEGIIGLMEIIKEIIEVHKVNEIPCKVDLEGL